MAKKKTTKKVTKKAATAPAKRGSAKAIADPASAPAAPAMAESAVVTPARKPKKKNANPGVVMVPTYDQIAARAFKIWELKGKPAGQDDANWRQAEAELLAETKG